MAVDGQMKTFWASKFDDTTEPVEFLVDLGVVHNLKNMDIFWEFPARSFSVSLSTDGEHFNEVFATDANVLHTSRMALGGSSARKVRIMMKEVCWRGAHKSADRLFSKSVRVLRTFSCLLIAAPSNGCVVRTFLFVVCDGF